MLKHDTIETIYRKTSGKVKASLIRLLNNFDLAEEATHETFEAALQTWPVEGVPQNPTAWLISTGRFKAIDVIRRQSRFQYLELDISEHLESIAAVNTALAEKDIEDDHLRLIFTCCHPALDIKMQVPLTLREVCGLTTEKIANAFLTSSVTMPQRIVRGKNKIRATHIPFVVPESKDLDVARKPSIIIKPIWAPKFH